MLAPKLLRDVQRLSQNEKQELFDWLVDALSSDPEWQDLAGMRDVRMPEPIRVSDEAIAMFESFEEEARQIG